MNRNDFLNMIGSRARVNRSMLGEVYELVDLFPYFQSAHMLLLKGLRDNEDIKFEKQLRSSAIHIADREVLYYLLKNEASAKIALKNEPESDSLYESSSEMQQTVIDSAGNSEQLISAIEMDIKPKDEVLNNDSETLSPGHSVLMPSILDDDDSDGVVLFIEENDQNEEEKIFYMEPGFSVSENYDLLELDTEYSYNEKLTGEFEIDEAYKGTDKKDFKKHLQSELIDKFIIANPRIEPIRDKTLQIQDMFKPHIEEKESFVTETLARIYITQGYYSKAIDIYTKLSLKFPEKSSYFAAQIEKVKDYIKK